MDKARPSLLQTPSFCTGAAGLVRVHIHLFSVSTCGAQVLLSQVQ